MAATAPLMPKSVASERRTSARTGMAAIIPAGGSGAQGAGRGVQADRRRGGQVEALGLSIQGYPDPRDRRLGQRAGQAVRLRTEQPRGRTAQLTEIGRASC